VTLDSNSGAFYRLEAAEAPAPHATTVTLDAANPSTGVSGSSVTVAATLSGAVPVAGQPIEFTLAGAAKIALTDASGKASTTFKLDSPAGSYDLAAGFDGDPANSASGASHAFTITKQPVTLTLTAAASGTFGTLPAISASLKDNAGNGLGQRSIFFVIANVSVPLKAQTKTVITDYLGVAPLGPITLPAGTYRVTAYFNGSITLLPSATVVTLSDDVYQNATSATKTYAINPWTFTGYLWPINNPPKLNVAKANSYIPFRFGLGGNQGLAILAGAPVVTKFTCATGVPTVDVPIDPSLNSTGLFYVTAIKQYLYIWKPPASYAGSCYEFKLTLIDGTSHSALFKFK
jgi:hypothetical protein